MLDLTNKGMCTGSLEMGAFCATEHGSRRKFGIGTTKTAPLLVEPIIW